MKYEPPHDRKVVSFKELLNEYFPISHSGFMRMYAQDREHDAIIEEIATRLEEVFKLDGEMDYWICDMTDACKSDWDNTLIKFSTSLKLLIIFPDNRV